MPRLQRSTRSQYWFVPWGVAPVTAYVRGASGGGVGGAAAPAGGGAGGSGSSGTGPLSAPKIMRITVNPLTKSVTAKLL